MNINISLIIDIMFLLLNKNSAEGYVARLQNNIFYWLEKKEKQVKVRPKKKKKKKIGVFTVDRPSDPIFSCRPYHFFFKNNKKKKKKKKKNVDVQS